MALSTRTASSAPCSTASKARCFSNIRPSVNRATRRDVIANACKPSQTDSAVTVARREALLASIALPLLMQQAAHADTAYAQFFGMASPPTSYGGYGGNANESPKYTFEYPAGWKQEVPSKVEKGTQGIDGRVVNPRSKDQRAFVITLTRAGEDNARFQLTDTESTFASFAGADYDLQDALSDATSTDKSEAEKEGIKFFNYKINSPAYVYLSSIAVKDGKVFALFVRSPSRMYASAANDLQHIVDTFKLL
ncbi:thylakoid lumen protein [Scenedesmus sp. NREL 46B-D3]|nr:thylakoid lumen protein [Scenedesmus sp. NREL 46B-D3]